MVCHKHFKQVMISLAGTPPCMDYEFTCDSGYCIPIHFLCDGDYDCGPGDYSDEDNENCEGKVLGPNLT